MCLATLELELVYGGPVLSGNWPSDRWEGADPTDITVLAEFAGALNSLRKGRSYASLDKAAAALPARAGRRRALPTSTLSDMLRGKSVPSLDSVVTYLEVCGLHSAEEQKPWLAAWERVSTAHQQRPRGAVRVKEAQPRVLGVRAAIFVESAKGELPIYVPRDLDADLHTALMVAAGRGGFVLLTGDSSVGKTRSLFEAIKAVLPEWWLIHPDGPEAIKALASASVERTVVWLDELRGYLDRDGGLPAGAIRGLINAHTVVVATLWTAEYQLRRNLYSPGQDDPHANDRELLSLATVIAVPGTFSTAERHRAEQLAGDRRVRVALDTPDSGFTQVLAAGPELIRWWEQAPLDQCYGKAVITAALDARRVGVRGVLTREFLELAAPGYLTPSQQANAPADWLDLALEYATTVLQGAASTLVPVPAGMGRIAGYEVADYLHQHALRVRRTSPLPDPAWHAIVHKLERVDPSETEDLYYSAMNRGRPGEAEALLRQLPRADRARMVDAVVAAARLAAYAGAFETALRLARFQATGNGSSGDKNLPAKRPLDIEIERLRPLAADGNPAACHRLAGLLFEGGHLDELAERAASDDWDAVFLLTRHLLDQGNVDEAISTLRPAADQGNQVAANWLAGLLLQHGRLDELSQRVNAGDRQAAQRLAARFVDQGRIEELRKQSDAVLLAADALVDRSRIDDAIALLRPIASGQNAKAAQRLAALLVEKDRVGEAVDVLRTAADAGDWGATYQLAELLADHDDIDGAIALLRQATGTDERGQLAVRRLACLLASARHIDEAIALLRRAADNGDRAAAYQLVDLLVDHHRLHDLHSR